MKVRTETSPKIIAMLRKSRREAKEGRLVSLGSFAKYVPKRKKTK